MNGTNVHIHITKLTKESSQRCNGVEHLIGEATKLMALLQLQNEWCHKFTGEKLKSHLSDKRPGEHQESHFNPNGQKNSLIDETNHTSALQLQKGLYKGCWKQNKNHTWIPASTRRDMCRPCRYLWQMKISNNTSTSVTIETELPAGLVGWLLSGCAGNLELLPLYKVFCWRNNKNLTCTPAAIENELPAGLVGWSLSGCAGNLKLLPLYKICC